MKSVGFSRDRSGAAAVEFALTAPVFLAILLGVVQVGFLLWTQLGLQNGVEAASRCAAVDSSLCANAASIQNYAVNNALGLNLPTSTFSYGTAACGRQVSASYTMNLFGLDFPATTISLSASACSPA